MLFFFGVHLKFRIVYNDGIKVTWKSLELRFAPPPLPADK